MTELPPKPELEHRERVGEYGEIISELTPDSEHRNAEYLRTLHFAKVALYKMEIENEGNETTTQESKTIQEG